MSQPSEPRPGIMKLHVRYSEPRKFTTALLRDAWKRLSFTQFLSFLRLKMWAFRISDPVTLQMGEREFAIISRYSVQHVARALEFANSAVSDASTHGGSEAPESTEQSPKKEGKS